jgi:hypothetical protein
VGIAFTLPLEVTVWTGDDDVILNHVDPVKLPERFLRNLF